MKLGSKVLGNREFMCNAPFDLHMQTYADVCPAINPNSCLADHSVTVRPKVLIWHQCYFCLFPLIFNYFLAIAIGSALWDWVGYSVSSGRLLGQLFELWWCIPPLFYAMPLGLWQVLRLLPAQSRWVSLNKLWTHKSFWRSLQRPSPILLTGQAVSCWLIPACR